MGPQNATQDATRVDDPRGEPTRRAEAYWLTVGMTETAPAEAAIDRSLSGSSGVGEAYEANTNGP